MGVQGPVFEYEVIQQTMFIGTSTFKGESSFLSTKKYKVLSLSYRTIPIKKIGLTTDIKYGLIFSLFTQQIFLIKGLNFTEWNNIFIII